MHVGADVTEGFPQAEAQTKTQTNIFATGYENGSRITIGASLKGRIWSYRVADSIKQWVTWCDHVGSKLTDSGISVDEVMRGFIRPRVVDARPPHIPLAMEWPWVCLPQSHRGAEGRGVEVGATRSLTATWSSLSTAKMATSPSRYELRSGASATACGSVTAGSRTRLTAMVDKWSPAAPASA